MNIRFNTTVDGFSSQVSSQYTATGTGTHEVRETIADSTTDGVVNLGLDVSTIKFLYVLSDKALTIKSYDGVTLRDTISVSANSPLIYGTGLGSNPFTVDFTSLKVTNASGGSATLTILAACDATP